MSIYGTVIAVNLALNSSMTIDSDRNIYPDRINQPHQIAQIPLDKYDDGIKEGRAELDHLITVIRNRPKLTPRQKAIGIYKLYRQRATALDRSIEQGLFGTYMLIENKDIIVQRWKTERDTLNNLAGREIEPHLTAKERKDRDLGLEMERKMRAMLNDPAQMKRIREQIEAERDNQKLRGIIPQ
jgi:hypothetical protein